MATARPDRMRTALIVTAVVAVALVAALVWVLMGRPADADDEPVSVATETTSAPATPEPSAEPTPTPTPEGPPSIIALTAAGELVELDPADGSTVRTVAADAAWAGPLSLTPDRSAVYLTRPKDGPARPDIVAVSLADGAAEVVAEGYAPALSPDGTRLAYVGTHPTNPDTEYRALHVLDLATGEITYVPDNTCGGCSRRIDQPAWSADGSTLYVAAGFQDSPVPSLDLLVVVPGTTADLDTAPTLQTGAMSNPGEPVLLPDGRLVVASVVDTATGDGLARFSGAIETVDLATSGTQRWMLPELHMVTPDEASSVQTTDTAAAPVGTAVAFVVTDWTGAEPVDVLYLWGGGATLTRLAEGITAVAW